MARANSPIPQLASICVALIISVTSFARAGTPFVLESVDAVGFASEYTSLALDAQGNHHISYYDAATADLKYAFGQRGVWSIESPDTAGVVGSYSSIAVDAEGNPHISYWYSNGANGSLRYAARINGVWVIQTVDNTANVGYFTSITLDGQGNPHISYYDAFPNYNLKYAVKSGGSWSFETVDAGGNVGCSTDIAVDAQGNPHIGYYDCTNLDLKYAVKTGAVWSIEVVDALGDVGWFVSVALDGQDNPHISYLDNTNGDLKYAAKEAGLWLRTAVDTSAGVGAHTSIALDAQGNAHISYFDNVNDDLKYAVGSALSWSAETVDAADVGWYTSIALDAQGNPHISYYDFGNDEIKFADSAVHLRSPVGGEHWAPGGQATVMWDGTGAVDVFISQDAGATYTNLLLGVGGGSVLVDVPAWSTTTARVKIVRNSPYSVSASPEVFSVAPVLDYPWWTTTVDAKTVVGQYTSLALGADGQPHISYYDATALDLRYAAKTGGGWSFETVHAKDDVGRYASLFIDVTGSPHIAYYDATSGDLLYANKTSGAWAFAIVEATGNVGSFTSLAVGENGAMHISYYDNTNLDLKYASAKSGGSWSIEVVDAVGDVGRYTSLALDAEGNPHISYYDNTDGELWYAVKSGTWSLEQVDADGDVGQYTSLALDAEGNPHISYYDATTASLKYAARSNGAWSTEVADGAKTVGEYTSLALDGWGAAHISYYGGDLLYANNASGGWSTELIDATGLVGSHTSLVLDADGNPRVSYYDDTNGDLKYASAAVEVSAPAGGDVWPVGASRAITWDGAGRVDIRLSVDGGSSYPTMLAGGVSGGRHDIIVPHTPSRFCRIKIDRRVEANTFRTFFYPQSSAQSDSFFTIETSVTLLALLVSSPAEGPGLVVTWETEPGPEDLDGYRVERRRIGDAAWLSVATTKETRYHDTAGNAGDQYRLFAINGLGDEFYLGETRGDSPPSLGGKVVAYPVPFRDGELTILFENMTSGGRALETEVAIYDVLGRRVATVAKRRFSDAVSRVVWDGRDESGGMVASGIYFIRLQSGQTQHTRKLVVVR